MRFVASSFSLLRLVVSGFEHDEPNEARKMKPTNQIMNAPTGKRKYKMALSLFCVHFLFTVGQRSVGFSLSFASFFLSLFSFFSPLYFLRKDSNWRKKENERKKQKDTEAHFYCLVWLRIRNQKGSNKRRSVGSCFSNVCFSLLFLSNLGSNFPRPSNRI